MNLDPLRRTGYVAFQLDRVATFSSPDLQTSPNVGPILGWADSPASWVSTAIGNGGWSYRARSWGVAVGAGPGVTGRYASAIAFTQSGGAGIPRSLYLYVNKGIQALSVDARSLYLYVNKAMYEGVISVDARSLYLYVNKAMYEGALSIEARALYLYLASRDGEVFPHLSKIVPSEQYELGQVELYGDGFGQYVEARDAATLTVSSVNAGNIAENVRDDTSAAWKSNDGASSWIRFTWGAAKRIVAVSLMNPYDTTRWGTPRFTFDDATFQDGSGDVATPDSYQVTTEYPVGAQRSTYWLATPKVTTYVQVGIASGGTGTNRGLSEVWVIEEAVPPQAAETSRAVLNRGLPSEQTMGIVAWQNRSPNWHPANSGVPPLSAATVTVPTGAVSGLVTVEETT